MPTPVLKVDLLAESLSDVLVRRLWLEGYGVATPDELMPPHDSEAERRIIAATYWGYAKPIILRAINASHFFDQQCARLWSAAQATQRETPHPGAPSERTVFAMLYQDVPRELGPLSDWIESAVRKARAMGGVGSIAAVLVEILDTYRFADEPQLLRYADTVIEMAERRQMLKTLRRAVVRLATGTARTRDLRDRLVRRLGGVLP